MLDPIVLEERKSEPLYRDLSEDNSIIQYVYRGYNDVNARSMAMSMIKRGKQKEATCCWKGWRTYPSKME
jgi:hypothetical protein